MILYHCLKCRINTPKIEIILYIFACFLRKNENTRLISVLSLTENTQRYKSLAGFAIFPSGAIFAYGKRYALWGVRGFISYRIRAKRQYIARAKRVYRVCLQTYRKAEKRDNISVTNRFVISFCRYKGLGLARNAFDRSNAMLALSDISKFSAKSITLS